MANVVTARACADVACDQAPVMADSAGGQWHVHCGACGLVPATSTRFGVVFADCTCGAQDVLAGYDSLLVEVVAGVVALPDALEVPRGAPAATPAAKPGRKPRASRKVPKEQLGLAW